VTVELSAVGAISLFVGDVPLAKSWYVRVFGRPVAYEDATSAVIRFDNTVVNLLLRTAAPELIAPAVVGDPGAGASAQYTIWVDDADAACAHLAANGVELLNGPMDRPWGQRTAAFADPDGHIWEVAQSIG
jgi:catechol 2,3-dioxygenase-like lactoylglutathione lyase family enzyme